MKIGIVGSEAAKFTRYTEWSARKAIRALIAGYDTVVSGGCHLGGIDIWAMEEALKAGLKTEEYKPQVLSWGDQNGLMGYQSRNRLIAENSHKVVCITLQVLPPTYTGMRFKYCYHCKTDQHVKSGGCWTTKYAREKLGKPSETIVIALPTIIASTEME